MEEYDYIKDDALHKKEVYMYIYGERYAILILINPVV